VSAHMWFDTTMGLGRVSAGRDVITHRWEEQLATSYLGTFARAGHTGNVIDRQVAMKKGEFKTTASSPSSRSCPLCLFSSFIYTFANLAA